MIHMGVSALRSLWPRANGYKHLNKIPIERPSCRTQGQFPFSFKAFIHNVQGVHSTLTRSRCIAAIVYSACTCLIISSLISYFCLLFWWRLVLGFCFTSEKRISIHNSTKATLKTLKCWQPQFGCRKCTFHRTCRRAPVDILQYNNVLIRMYRSKQSKVT